MCQLEVPDAVQWFDSSNLSIIEKKKQDTRKETLKIYPKIPRLIQNPRNYQPKSITVIII